MELKEIDVTRSFVDDSKGFWDGFWDNRNGLGAPSRSADPDSASAMLKIYHQMLWSRRAPNGQMIKLKKGRTSDYLVWNNMKFASDSIATQHRYVKCANVIKEVQQQIEDYRQFVYDTTRFMYTIGGMIIFPRLCYRQGHLESTDRRSLFMACTALWNAFDSYVCCSRQ